MEAEAERKAIDKAVAEWKAKKANQSGQATNQEEDDDDRDIYTHEDESFGPEVSGLSLCLFPFLSLADACYND